MKFTGQWYNKDYSGEGISVVEYSDGKVIAHFFGYDDNGLQQWLIGVGVRKGDAAELTAYVTWKDPHKGVEERRWGSIVLSYKPSRPGEIFFSKTEDEGAGSSYWMRPLYRLSVEDVSPEPVFGSVFLYKWLGERWSDNPIPLPLFGRMDPLMRPHQLVVRDAPVHVRDVFTTDPRASVLGISAGQTLEPGTYPISYHCAGDWKQRETWKWGPKFVVSLEEHGKIIELTLQVDEDY